MTGNEKPKPFIFCALFGAIQESIGEYDQAWTGQNQKDEQRAAHFDRAWWHRGKKKEETACLDIWKQKTESAK